MASSDVYLGLWSSWEKRTNPGVSGGLVVVAF